MEKSKSVMLLRACNENEILQLEKFLLSPYINEDEQVVQIFKLLKAHHPEYDARVLTKAHLYNSIYPGQTYDGKQLGYLLSKLNKFIEKFIVFEKAEKSPHQYNLTLMECLSERGMNKSYEQVNRNLDKSLSNEIEGYSSQLFWAQFKWAEIREQHFQKQLLRKHDDNIELAAHRLDRFYFLKRLILSCAMLDRQTIFQQSYQVGLTPGWIEYLKQQDFFGEPIMQLYYNIYQALNEEEEEIHFIRLKDFLLNYAQRTAPDDLEDIYIFAINYCARKIRQGKENYLAEAFKLYQVGIEKGVLLKNGMLSPWNFANVVKLSLRLQYYEWVESFIQEYAKKLPVAFRENALHYNLAELFYYTRRFDEAQGHLYQVAYSDLNYYLGARVLLAKIYYELEETEPLLSLIASFTIFLKRNKKLSNDLKHTYLNFCQILFQIVRRSPNQIKKLEKKIHNTSLLTDRSWLAGIYKAALQDVK